MGKLVTVEITETGKHFMKCQLVKDGEVKRPVSVPPPLPKGQVSGFKQVLDLSLSYFVKNIIFVKKYLQVHYKSPYYHVYLYINQINYYSIRIGQ